MAKSDADGVRELLGIEFAELVLNPWPNVAKSVAWGDVDAEPLGLGLWRRRAQGARRSRRQGRDNDKEFALHVERRRDVTRKGEGDWEVWCEQTVQRTGNLAEVVQRDSRDRAAVWFVGWPERDADRGNASPGASQRH